jgi:hypothetical protein
VLADDGVAYLSGIESGEQLRELAVGLGVCIEPGVGMPGGMHDGHYPTNGRRNGSTWSTSWALVPPSRSST